MESSELLDPDFKSWILPTDKGYMYYVGSSEVLNLKEILFEKEILETWFRIRNFCRMEKGTWYWFRNLID